MNASSPRIAMIGATRGVSLIQSIWQPQGLARPAAICDLNEPLARQRAAEFPSDQPPVPVFTNVEALLKWGEFDAALIATSDATHYKIASSVLDRGFHCFVEKPMTTSVPDARDLVRRWRRSGKVGVVGHEFRYAQAIIEAKQKIEQGVIGTPRLAMTVDSCGRMGSFWRRREWHNSHKPPGNTLTLQKAVHQLDIQMYLMNSRPLSVYASAGQNHFGGDKAPGLTCEECDVAAECMYSVDKVRINGLPNPKSTKNHLCVFGEDVDLHDNQIVTLNYASGARGSYIECFFTPDYKVEHTIIGDRGRLSIQVFNGNPYQRIEVSWIGATRQEHWIVPSEGGHGGGDDRLAKIFTDGIREKRQVKPDLEDGFNVIAVACAIDQSAAQGCLVPVAELE
jgi:predicted dehydrogenase